MKPPSMSQKMTPRAEESCAKRVCAPSVPKESADIMPSSPIVKKVTKLSGFITREIGFAIGDVHGAPEDTGPEGGENAVHGLMPGACVPEEAIARMAAPTHMMRVPRERQASD